MKKTYLAPEIRMKSIESDAILDESLPGLPLYDENNPNTVADDMIRDGGNVLTNGTSVWDE